MLSPLLYLLFCDDKCGDERMRANGSALFAGPDGNDMVRVGNLMFADDLNTLSHTVEGLQENLDLCAKWAADGNVRFNLVKSYAMVLSAGVVDTGTVASSRAADKRADALGAQAKLTLGGQPLAWVTSFVYLGVPFATSVVRTRELWTSTRFAKAK